MSVGNLTLKLLTDTIPSVIQSVTTDDKFPSVVTDWITDGKVSVIKKRRVADVEVLAGYFFRWNHRRIQKDSPYNDITSSPFKLPTESPRDLKWQIRTVMCRLFRHNHRRFHRWSFRRGNRWEKLIYVRSADPLLPYFSFFFLIPTLPICKQPAPLPPNKNLPHISTTSYIFWSSVVTASVL
jgi:hypothetical protein